MKKFILSAIAFFVPCIILSHKNQQAHGKAYDTTKQLGATCALIIFLLNLTRPEGPFGGSYDITNEYNISTYICLCGINAELPKKSNTTVTFFKDAILNTNIGGSQFSYCNQMGKLQMDYILQDGIEYFTGRWYGDKGLGGLFVLQHTDSVTFKKVDAYFPNLDKLIAQAKNGSTSSETAITADSTKPIYADQELIDALKKATQKKIKG